MARRFQSSRWQVVDLDHRPDLGVHATDGSLQRTFCPNCIGPGVETPGTFCIVRRAGDRLQVANYIPGGTKDIAGEMALVHALLSQQCEAAGIPDRSREWVGTRLFQKAADIDRDVEEQWPDFKRTIDPVMLTGPLLPLLNASGPAARADALLGHPDLARPNVEHFFGMLIDNGTAVQR